MLLLAATAGATATTARATAARATAATASATLTRPASQTSPPRGFRLSADTATAIADRSPVVRAVRRGDPGLRPTAYTSGPRRWQVSYFAHREERAQVTIDDRSGAVVEAWTGPQVRWRMARGYEGAFGRKLNAPYVWLPLCLLFLAPFVDPRRPFRLLHLDLIVLLSFGASQIFFNRGEISASVLLVYPVLAYLLARMVWTGLRPRRDEGRLIPLVPLSWLALGLLFLIGFRIGLNVIDSGVIDVGYASVVGADRIAAGESLYGAFPADVAHGDTYGPVTYLAYLPFEQMLPWHGRWEGLAAAHAAAIAFDLLTALALFLLGRRLGGARRGMLLGVALAYGWTAYPYSSYVLASNANDSLVAALLVLALLALASPPGRGALVALAGVAKFAALALAPLFLAAADRGHPRADRLRRSAVFGCSFALVAGGLLLAFLPDGGARELYDRTIGYQAGRDSPFSVWGLEPSLAPLHAAVTATAIALAILVAFVPHRKNIVQVAALAAAVLIALQIAAAHWFYLYIVWFFPLTLVALFGPHGVSDGPSPSTSAQPRTGAGLPSTAPGSSQPE